MKSNTMRNFKLLAVASLVLSTLGAVHEARPAADTEVEIQATARNGAFFFNLSKVSVREGKDVRAASLCVVRHQEPYFSSGNIEFLACDSTNRLGVGVGDIQLTVDPVAGKTWGEVAIEDDVTITGLEDVLRNAPERSAAPR
jgi:hypothetical protein